MASKPITLDEVLEGTPADKLIILPDDGSATHMFIGHLTLDEVNRRFAEDDNPHAGPRQADPDEAPVHAWITFDKHTQTCDQAPVDTRQEDDPEEHCTTCPGGFCFCYLDCYECSDQHWWVRQSTIEHAPLAVPVTIVNAGPI